MLAYRSLRMSTSHFMMVPPGVVVPPESGSGRCHLPFGRHRVLSGTAPAFAGAPIT